MPEIFAAWRQVIDEMLAERLIPTIVSPVTSEPLPIVRPGELSLFCTAKNDEKFLLPFYRHYKEIGVKHFFIVDDGSTVPVEAVLPQADVQVFRPEAGTFATAKGMWLGALIKYFLEPGMWSLTVDVDEFLDLPPGLRNLNEVVSTSEKQGLGFIPAILLDMIPDPEDDLIGKGFLKLLDGFKTHALVTGNPSPEYRDHSSIKWGFGKYDKLSWTFDARYHAYKTFDSLRKVPLVRYRERLHLNQGFHDVHYTDGTPSLGLDIWLHPHILPLRHYKTLKIFEEELFARTQSYVGTRSTEYHKRTSENITKIFGKDQKTVREALLRIPRTNYSRERFGSFVSELRYGEAAAERLLDRGFGSR